MNPTNMRDPGTPFPTVGTALLLTFGAIVAGGLVGLLFIDLGPLAAEGLGTALGIGVVATLAARRVGDPQAQRLGFVSLEWRAWPLVLGLVPTIFLASELDNFAYDLAGGSSPTEAAASPTPMRAPAVTRQQTHHITRREHELPRLDRARAAARRLPTQSLPPRRPLREVRQAALRAHA